MSLWDVDKNSDNRLNTQINADDVMHQMKAKSTDSIVHRAESTITTNGKIKIKDDHIIVNDGTNDRVLIGRLDGGF
jgi:hypothetical protein